uniref:Uncharacterized protein n=1 Tax=Anguilla anguilla TaxID=7936 RepID=A0A0E9TAM3_ANGAN
MISWNNRQCLHGPLRIDLCTRAL